MKTLQLYNTQKREKQAVKKGEIKLYTCGPTVYNFAHIGNLRTYIFEDLLKRTLRFFGHGVRHVMNITDVEDKTIRSAMEAGESLAAYTEKYTAAFLDDLNTLGIEPADHYPKATDHVPEMIAMIEKLITKDLAYVGKEGSVYFRIGGFSSYGKLSHLKLDELEVGASERVSSDEYDKDNASDFVLWKSYDETRDGTVFWESPWGKGRPGWHIECSAMAIKHLGETIDIHCGGVDNIFPHHENEIAQSEGCTGKCFAKMWVHAEHLIVDGKKMSKSLGNFYTLRDLLDKGFTGEEVRYLLLATHYRTQLNFTFDGLTAARNSLERLGAFVRRLSQADGKGTGQMEALIDSANTLFHDALADDLNISAALAALFDFVRDANALIDGGHIGSHEKTAALKLLHHFDIVLHVIPFPKEEAIPSEIQKLFEERKKARAEKNWAESDRLRDELQSRGYVIEDAPTGSTIHKA